ncbi:MAG: hypothetical protein KKD05_06510 [Candidatus Omnitrophica bacterium]|nr:hypothetical protein [Candidatus Omnitrophota bacterium]
MFKENKMYTRDQIHEKLGGNKQIYLPTVNNQVVCACLDHALNPEAPKVILVGSLSKTRKNADILCSQLGAIPVFIKIKSNQWEYMGEWKVKRCSNDKVEILKHEEESGREELYKIIFLTKC